MTERPDNIGGPDLDRYLDSLMDEAEARRFEQRLETDPALRAALETHRAIAGSLQRRFGAVPAVRFDPAAAVTSSSPAGTSPLRRAAVRRALYWAAAAVLTVAAVWAWQSLTAPPPGWDPIVVRAPEDINRLYRQELADGFHPSFKCESQQEFAAYTHRRFGAAIVVAATPGVEVLGWEYGKAISPATSILLVSADGVKTVVLMDAAAADHPLPEPAPGLSLFRRELAGVILYEISPRPRPLVLDLFHQVDPPPGSGDLGAPDPDPARGRPSGA